MKNKQIGFIGIVVTIIIALALGIGVTYYITKEKQQDVISNTTSTTPITTTAPSTSNHVNGDRETAGTVMPQVNNTVANTNIATGVTTNEGINTYTNTKFKYKFQYIPQLAHAYSCNNDTLINVTNEARLVVLLTPSSTNLNFSCSYAPSWYMFPGYDTSVEVISESSVAWEKRLNEFSQSGVYFKYGQSGNKHARTDVMVDGKSFGEMISRNGEMTYVVRYKSASRTSTTLLLDSFEFID